MHAVIQVAYISAFTHH